MLIFVYEEFIQFFFSILVMSIQYKTRIFCYVQGNGFDVLLRLCIINPDISVHFYEYLSQTKTRKNCTASALRKLKFQGDASVLVSFVICFGVDFVLFQPYVRFRIFIKVQVTECRLLGNRCLLGVRCVF